MLLPILPPAVCVRTNEGDGFEHALNSALITGCQGLITHLPTQRPLSSSAPHPRETISSEGVEAPSLSLP